MKKSGIKPSKPILCLLLAGVLLLSFGCKTGRQNKSPNYLYEEELEEVNSAKIIIKSISTDGKLAVGYETETVPAGLEGKVNFTVKPGKGRTVTGTFAASGEAEFEVNTQEGTLTVTAEYKDTSGEVTDTAELRFIDGLIQLTEDSVPFVVSELTDEEKANLITGISNPKKGGASGGTYAIERLGIPSVTVNDGPAGVRYGVSVWYPSVMNLTASWDRQLIYDVGAAIGGDALALGIDIVLAPGMNIQKNVLGGRNFEYCAEDPLLTALSASAYTSGVQSSGAGACLKHFAANEQETNRGSVNVQVTERALREIYLKPFELAVKYSSPASIMSSYNALNGAHTSIKKDLLTGILRDEWNYPGMVMSDWGSAGAVEDKVNAQNDIKMPGEAGDAKTILAGLSSGKVDPEALNKCCEHILYTVTRTPTFRGLEMDTGVDFTKHEEVAETAAADTMILLQNENSALPLKDGASVALFGNGAYKTVYGGEGSGSVNPRITVSIASGIKNCDKLTICDENSNIFRGAQAHSKTDSSLDLAFSPEYAAGYAAKADAAVIVISRSSTEGADNSLVKGDYYLNDTEFDMIRNVSDAFHALGKKVTVLINTGSPIEICSWRELVDAILFIGYPGQNAGLAAASVLTGRVNPSAKTTITWPVEYSDTPTYKYFPGSAGSTTYYEDIYVGYRYYSTFGVDTAYPFGYGLSYTSFEYSDFELKTNSNGSFTAKVKVTNTGSCAGRETVQIYVTKPETTLEQPVNALCGFAKTGTIEPGESETVSILITKDALSSYDTENSRYIIDSGKYVFHAASSAETLLADAEITVAEPEVLADVENRCAPSPEPAHIVKSEYTLPEARPEEDIIGTLDNVKKRTSSYEIDLGAVQAVGEIQLYWDGLDSPVVVSVAGEDKKYSRFDVYASEGLSIMEVNLFGTEVRYIKVAPVKKVVLSDVIVYKANDADRQAGSRNEYENVARRKKVTAASVEGGLNPPYAVDGNFTTRWGSLPTGETWLRIDLGEAMQIKGLMAYLESAYVPYHIEYSTDGKNYTTLASFSAGELFIKLSDLNVEARYVRFVRDGSNWFSIYEVEIYA